MASIECSCIVEVYELLWRWGNLIKPATCDSKSSASTSDNLKSGTGNHDSTLRSEKGSTNTRVTCRASFFERFGFTLPETVVFQNSKPYAWYFISKRDGALLRKKSISFSAIEKTFTSAASQGSSRSGASSSGGGSSGGHQGGGGTGQGNSSQQEDGGGGDGSNSSSSAGGGNSTGGGQHSASRSNYGGRNQARSTYRDVTSLQTCGTTICATWLPTRATDRKNVAIFLSPTLCKTLLKLLEEQQAGKGMRTCIPADLYGFDPVNACGVLQQFCIPDGVANFLMRSVRYDDRVAVALRTNRHKFHHALPSTLGDKMASRRSSGGDHESGKSEIPEDKTTAATRELCRKAGIHVPPVTVFDRSSSSQQRSLAAGRTSTTPRLSTPEIFESSVSRKLFLRAATFEGEEALSGVSFGFEGKVNRNRGMDDVIACSRPLFARIEQEKIRQMHFLTDDEYIALHFKIDGRTHRAAFIFAAVVSEEEARAQCDNWLAGYREKLDPLRHEPFLHGGIVHTAGGRRVHLGGVYQYPIASSVASGGGEIIPAVGSCTSIGIAVEDAQEKDEDNLNAHVVVSGVLGAAHQDIGNAQQVGLVDQKPVGSTLLECQDDSTAKRKPPQHLLDRSTERVADDGDGGSMKIPLDAAWNSTYGTTDNMNKEN
ncbi:unnamed protein product, partial [Amoebophrya sp. A25]|eukprot:GSA25T00019342001.1